jgi:hypothetical protein
MRTVNFHDFWTLEKTRALQRLPLPTVPRGPGGKFRHEIGETVKASPICPYAGEFKITGRYKENGHCYYLSNSLTFREKDIA